MFSFSLDIYPGVELLDHMVALFLVFLGNLHTVFPNAAAAAAKSLQSGLTLCFPP